MKENFQPVISILTVNFGTAKKVINLWKSLKNYPPKFSYEFIVIDNNSNDSDLEKLNTFFAHKDSAHVLPLTANTGFGAGNDEGVHFAKGKILAFINPDIEITSHCLDHLINILKNDEKVGIVTPILETRNGKPLENVWKFPSVFSLIKRRLSKKAHSPSKNKEPVPVEWAQGSFLMMRKDFFTKKLKGFDPRFFLFLEDTDLCRKCWELGFRVLQVPTAKAFHEEKRLSGEGIFSAMFRKTFWIHVLSAIKYFLKYKKKSLPKIF